MPAAREGPAVARPRGIRARLRSRNDSNGVPRVRRGCCHGHGENVGDALEPPDFREQPHDAEVEEGRPKPAAGEAENDGLRIPLRPVALRFHEVLLHRSELGNAELASERLAASFSFLNAPRSRHHIEAVHLRCQFPGR